MPEYIAIQNAPLVREIQSLLDQNVSEKRLADFMTASGPGAVPAGLRVYAGSALSASRKQRLRDVLLALPDWHSESLAVLKHGDFASSLAAAELGWDLSADKKSNRLRQQEETARQQETLRVLDDLHRLQGQSVVIKLWEGMRRKGVLSGISGGTVNLYSRATLLGKSRAINRQIPISDIASVEVDNGQ